MSKKKKTNVSAPSITHSPTKEGQMQFFQEEAAKFARKAHSDKGGNGKGSRPRTSINSPEWRNNYDDIFRKNDTNEK